MKVATAALIVKRLQAQDVARRAASQSATQSATQSASKDASKAEQVVTLTVKREGEELTTAAKRAEMAVKQEEKPMVAVKQEGEKPTTTAQSPLRIRVKVKTEAPTGKSLLNEVLEAPQWQQPDRSNSSPR